jgi:ribosomal-protein-alanine N-acetyltransferase
MYTFEKMVAADIEEVITIEQSVFSSPWTTGMVRAELFDNPFSFSFVIRHLGQMVGYLFFWEVAGEFHIMNLAVSPKHQRQGVGTEGMKWILEMARKKRIHAILLEVRVSNTAARSLYHKFDFYEAGARKKYYDTPIEDAILYQCDLRPSPH